MTIDYDPATKKCTVRGATELPSEIFDHADDIEILDASFCQLSTLPDRITDLTKLRIAFFANNEFDTIPDVLASCLSLEMVGFKSCRLSSINPHALPTGLRGLILTDNDINELPTAISRLSNLQKLMLTGNNITVIPDEILNCRNLQVLRISLNQLAQSPEHVFQLPRLAWYSDSGNPFSQQSDMADTRTIDWKQLKIGELLGKSSKNEVYAAVLDGQQVAVKLFGLGITTDGSPAIDIELSMKAGTHPHLIGGIAKVTNGPDGRNGLVMPRIPATYHQVGKPPDMQSLTRCVFPDSPNFSEEFVSRVAADVATAMTHLAGQGIMHGDVYAHNLLARNDGESYLGDFGASSAYNPNTDDAVRREKIDVRGYGYLLEDLLAHLPHPTNGPLHELKTACLLEDPTQRPTFRAISAILSDQPANRVE